MKSSMSRVRHHPGELLLGKGQGDGKTGESKLSGHLPLINNTSYENALHTRISKYSNVVRSLSQPADLGILMAWSPFSSWHAWDRTTSPVKLLLVRPELGQGRQVEDLGIRWPWVVMT